MPTPLFGCTFGVATIRGERFFFGKPADIRRHPQTSTTADKVRTSDTVTTLEAVSSKHSLSVVKTSRTTRTALALA